MESRHEIHLYPEDDGKLQCAGQQGAGGYQCRVLGTVWQDRWYCTQSESGRLRVYHLAKLYCIWLWLLPEWRQGVRNRLLSLVRHFGRWNAFRVYERGHEWNCGEVPTDRHQDQRCMGWQAHPVLCHFRTGNIPACSVVPQERRNHVVQGGGLWLRQYEQGVALWSQSTRTGWPAGIAHDGGGRTGIYLNPCISCPWRYFMESGVYFIQ